MNPNIAVAITFLMGFFLGLAIGYLIRDKEIKEEKSK